MFCAQRSYEKTNVNLAQMHETHKSGLTKVQMFDGKFAREQTSSNSVKHDFFLLFFFFLQNYGSSQMHQTFHQILEFHYV